MMVTCETWRNNVPRCLPGLRGPHFSLTLFGPLHPTRAVTAPAWRILPLNRNAILPPLFSKEPDVWFPDAQHQRAGNLHGSPGSWQLRGGRAPVECDPAGDFEANFRAGIRIGRPSVRTHDAELSHYRAGPRAGAVRAARLERYQLDPANRRRIVFAPGTYPSGCARNHWLYAVAGNIAESIRQSAAPDRRVRNWSEWRSPVQGSDPGAGYCVRRRAGA